MSITVTGRLADEPHKVTVGPCHDAAVVFSITNDNPLPFEAVLKVGDTPEAHLKAERLARRFHRGQSCIVHAEHIAERRDHGAPCMVLRHVAVIDVDGVRA